MQRARQRRARSTTPDMEQRIIELLGNLYRTWCGSEAEHFNELPPSGSNRRYYRMSGAGGTAIGVYNADAKENRAFLSFSRSLLEAGVRVPQIYDADEAYGVYLQQDLGDETLFSYLCRKRAEASGEFTNELKELYKSVLAELVTIQCKGAEHINFDHCYPRQAFDRQSMMWDLQYFKYYFLKLAHITFDEQALENDYNTLMDYLLGVDCSKFLYRDFQSRNVMVLNGEPWFIDYQGGRYGALQYDVASLLYDAKANIPDDVRAELLDHYMQSLRCSDRNDFEQHYYGYVLIRIMQAMGAYGYRGFFERKEHFLRSIPFALDNLKNIVENHMPPIEVPELRRLWAELCESQTLRNIAAPQRLKVTVTSFSYKHGIPVDNSGNGGGFVFDCRALPNPGRYKEYKSLTGRDAEVKAFFAGVADEMNAFIDAAKQLAAMSVERYMSRGFTSLTVSFGCTGGQHRSVFCADSMAQWLADTYDIDVELKHWEQKHLN